MRRLGRWFRRSRSVDTLEERFTTATLYARRLTETGCRCDASDGARSGQRICVWKAVELDETYAGLPAVGVRCHAHPGGRYSDHRRRSDLIEKAERQRGDDD